MRSENGRFSQSAEPDAKLDNYRQFWTICPLSARVSPVRPSGKLPAIPSPLPPQFLTRQFPSHRLYYLGLPALAENTLGQEDFSWASDFLSELGRGHQEEIPVRFPAPAVRQDDHDGHAQRILWHRRRSAFIHGDRTLTDCLRKSASATTRKSKPADQTTSTTAAGCCAHAAQRQATNSITSKKQRC